MAVEADATSARIAGATPNGGVASVAYFLDAAGRPCPRAEAVAVEVHELDDDAASIFRTYLERPAPAAIPAGVAEYLRLKPPPA